MSKIMTGILRMPKELCWDESPLRRAQHNANRFAAADEIERLQAELAAHKLAPLYLHPQPAPDVQGEPVGEVPSGYALIPLRNGNPEVTDEMKVECIGEFSWQEEAPYYDEDGDLHDYVATHAVPWSVCKAIYKKMAGVVMLTAAPTAPGVGSGPLPANRYGVDCDYFTEKLEILIRDMGNYTPDELARSLGRLSMTADSETMREPEFNTAPAVQREPVGWQFYQDGKWWYGDDRIKDHRKNTEEAGYPTRDVYAAPKLAEQQPDVTLLLSLLSHARCNTCDGSGGLYDNHGHPHRCQWCHDQSKALAAHRKQGGE